MKTVDCYIAALMASSAALSLLVTVEPAQAQDRRAPAAAPGQTSGEPEPPARRGAGTASETNDVVVTALRREQRVQDVPASLTVLSGDVIKAKGGQDFRDYLTTVPGVNFTEGNTGAMRVTIRGISDGVGGTDPLTGIYLDETPITESFYATLDPDVYDIDRIEVLRGPQGTLYGSGSMGGTIRIITKRPKLDAVEGSVAGTLADIADGGWARRVDGAVNVPVVDNLIALRVSGGYRKDDGWIDNVFTQQQDTNTVEKYNARAQVLVRPGPDTSIIAGFLYQKENLGAPANVRVSLPGYESSYIFRPFGGSDAKLGSLTVRQDFGSMTLTSATNYLGKNLVSASDAGTNILPVVNALLGVKLGSTEGVGVRSDTSFNLFTQEVRLASKGGNPFDWVIGAFYSNADTNVLQVFDFSQAPTAQAKASGAAFYTSGQEYQTRQLAGFGELTFHATKQLSFTAGLRVFNVQQSNITDSSGTLNGGSSTTIGRSSTTSIQQKYEIEFKPTKNNLLYAQAAQGYRNGGPTGNFPFSVCSTALASIGYSSVPTSYGPDKLWNYEVGSRNTLLNGRMTLNGAAYYIDWRNIQTSTSLSCGFGFVANSGRATSKGGELEMSLEPVDGLTLNGSLAYTDAKLERAAPGTRTAAGDPLPFVSKWAWNASVQYRRPIGDEFNAFVRGEVNHVGSRWNAYRAIGASATLLPAYTAVNVRLGIGGRNWTAAVFATNLFNERIITVRTTGSPALDLVGRPRAIGINTSFNF